MMKHIIGEGEKRLEKKAITWILLTLLLISMVTLAFNAEVSTQTSSASDWLGGWSYRKSHVINPAFGAGTNYQIMIKTHYVSGTDKH